MKTKNLSTATSPLTPLPQRRRGGLCASQACHRAGYVAFCFLIFAFCFSGWAQQTITTATVTFTNAAGTTNGQTISVNGVVRTFTNTITTANVQVATGTNIGIASSNLFLAYASFPQANTLISRPATNIVQFQSYPGFALTVLAGTSPTGWASVSYSTNTLTSMTVVRVPRSGMGNYERTNVESGLIELISSNEATNIVPLTAPAFILYRPIDAAGLTNFILAMGTRCTNFSLILSQNGTNFTVAVSNYFQGLWDTLGTMAFEPAANFQPGCDVLTNICALGNSILSGLSYIENPDNILLKHTNGVERLRANEGGDFTAKFEDGTTFLDADTSHNIKLESSGINRFESTDGGETVIRSKSGNNGLSVRGDTDAVQMYGVASESLQNWPATLIGTTTNFLSDADNSGTSDTTVDSFNVPANTMTNNGDGVIRNIGVKFLSGGGTKRVQVYFAGTSIFDSGAVSASSESYVSIRCEVTRRDSSTVAYNSGATGTIDGAGTSFAKVGTIGGLDFSTTKNFYIILTSSSSGAFLRVQSDNTRWAPSPAWAGFN